jgi:hypothetical protein
MSIRALVMPPSCHVVQQTAAVIASVFLGGARRHP